MMFRRIFFFLALMLFSAVGSAASISAEQNKLDLYHQAHENHQAELEDIANELFGFENKLADAKSDLQNAEKDLIEAQKNHTEARIALSAEASEKNERALSLVEHSLAMAERAIRTRTKRLNWVEEQVAELQALEVKVKSQINKSEDRIASQESKIARLEAEQVLAEQQRRIEAEKAKAAAIQRQQMEKSLAKPQEVAIAPAAVVAPESSSVDELSEADELSMLDEEALEFVRKEMSRLNELTKRPSGVPLYKNLLIEGKSITPQTFEYLGKNQYRVDTVVQSGQQTFFVGKFRFKRTIPAADNGKEYVFIFDSKRTSNPRLVIFKKSLLNLL